MKKITVFLILVFYMIPAIGVSMQHHYCDGKWASVSIIFTDSPSCACGKKEMKKDCCKDKTTILKITETQNYSKKIESSFSQTLKILDQNFPIITIHFKEIVFKKQLHVAHPPPWQNSNPLYLLHQVFLI